MTIINSHEVEFFCWTLARLATCDLIIQERVAWTRHLAGSYPAAGAWSWSSHNTS